MIILLYILVLLATFCVMEGITWLTHKYVMHGFLWYLHKDHHQVEPGFFEKNDTFFIIFAVPSILLIFLEPMIRFGGCRPSGLALWLMVLPISWCMM